MDGRQDLRQDVHLRGSVIGMWVYADITSVQSPLHVLQDPMQILRDFQYCGFYFAETQCKANFYDRTNRPSPKMEKKILTAF